ncbi:MAG TPA: Rid family hydrolase, partial [Acidimicrobiales bacterium]|nr:Rid family hydrolase [Acidimicrobiales bacterium]
EGQQEMLGFSQAVRVGDTVYVAGTLGIGEGLHIPESMAEQITLAYRNIGETLAHFGSSLADVVDQKVFVTDVDEALAATQARTAAFGGALLPASTMVEVSKLALPQAKVEISVTARLR